MQGFISAFLRVSGACEPEYSCPHADTRSARATAIHTEGTRLMSHAGPPSEPPPDPEESGAGADAPTPDQGAAPGPGPDQGQAEPPGPGGGQEWSPYPANWESSSRPPTPPSAPNPYGQQPPSGQPNPYEQGNPYSQQPPYGQPGQPGHPGQPANPYAGPANNKPTFGFGGYAGWFTRVGAYLIDYIASLVAALPLWIGYGILLSNTSTTTNADGTKTSHYSGSIGVPLFLILIGAITSIGFFVWNVCIRQGRTGASIGKSVLAIRLVNSDLQPIGGGWAFLRAVLHIVDSIPCYIGYLWPIWDSRKQTFADKIMNTFVIQATATQPRPY
jgi:uncharacterized RDD family membrane protein YckC